MSASREKKKRMQQTETATAVETSAKTCPKCIKRALTAVISVILVLCIVFLCLVGTGFLQKHTTAAVANGYKLTPAMLSYYYVSVYNNFASYLGTDTPLSELEYTTDEFDTWGDYLLDQAAYSAATAYATYDRAMLNGYVLSEETKTAIETELSTLDLYASMYGYADGNALLTAQYGTGCNMKNYEEYLTITATASAYSSEVYNSFTYTEEDIDTYYAENQRDFDAVSYRHYTVTPEVLGMEAGEEATAACEETAQNLVAAAVDGEQAFLDAISALLTDEDLESLNVDTLTLRENSPLSEAGEGYVDWLADPVRQENDATYLLNDEGSYSVLFFKHREDLTYQLPNVRHILLSVTDSEDEAAVAEAKAEAEHVLEEYMAGEQTEEAFAELAKTHSADGNAATGGLYENITPGYMVEAFESWCYDPARQVGDVEIVETEYGFHVMYFSGYGSTYLDYSVENVLRDADFADWNLDVTADMTYSVKESAGRYMVVQ